MNNFKKLLVCSLATATIACGAAGIASVPKAYAAATAPTITGANVTLNENIVLKFHVDDYSTDYAAKFTFDGKEYDATVENGVAEFGLVTPQYLDKEVTLTLTKEGETPVEKTTSIKNYLETLVNTDDSSVDNACEKNTYAKLKTLAVDMLDYGAEAQKKYLTGDYMLVNANLTDAQKAYATTFTAPADDAKATLSGEKSDVYSWVSAGIRFDYNVSLYFVIKPTTAGTVLKLEVNGETITSYEALENGGYKFRYDKVNVVDFANAYTVKVLDEENNAIGQTLSYSVNSYVLAKYADESMGGITKAVYNYGLSAMAYDAVKEVHNYEARLLKSDGTTAEVFVKPDFERKNYNLNPAKDDLDYLVNYSSAKLVCKNCSYKKDVSFSFVEPTKEYTKDDDSTDIIVDGKTYTVKLNVLYAKGVKSSLEIIDDSIYFVNTFEVKGYTSDEIKLITEGDKELNRDIVDTSVAGQITFKTDVTEYEGSVLPVNGNKTQVGEPYGLGISLRGDRNNIASSNQNGDVYSAEWDKDYEVLFNGKYYRSGRYWDKVAVIIESASGVSSADFVEDGGDVYLDLKFNNFYSESDEYKMWLEIGAGEYQALNITSMFEGNDVTISTMVSGLDNISAYIHFTKDGSEASTDGHSNLYPLKDFETCTKSINNKYYSIKSMQYGLHLTVFSGTATPIALDGGIMRYVHKGESGQALEFNRCFDADNNENLSNGFVDHILFTMYRKDDESKTAVGSFKLLLIDGKPFLVAEKNGASVQFTIDGKDTAGTVYGNLYRMVNDTNIISEFNTFLKTALWGEEIAGDYCLTAQVKAIEGTPLSDGDVYELPTDDNHTFTIV